MRQLYLSWIDYQRRPDSMRSAVGYELRFIPSPFHSRVLKPLGYLWQTAASAWALLRSRPDVVWFQLPPSFIVHLMWLARLLSGGRMLLIADCHNAALRAPWSTFPLTTALLNRMDLVLAHNREALDHARALGIAAERLQLLETRPAQLRSRAAARPTEGLHKGSRRVLVPLSYSVDEPVDVVLAAASMLPDVTFLLTGHLVKAQAKGYVARATGNVRFTGQVDVDKYNDFLVSCDLVLGITALEGIQLSAANEAVGASKPLVLSDTAILREMFGAAALFAPNDPSALARTITSALGQSDALAERSRELAAVRELRWIEQLGEALGGIGIRVAASAAASTGGAASPVAAGKPPRV